MRGRLPASILVLVFLSVVMGTAEFIVMGILTDIADSLEVEDTAVGLLVSVFAMSYGIATPLFSGYVGKYNLYRVLLFLTGVFLVSDIWSMFSSGYTSLLLSRVLTAASSGVLFSVSLTCAVELVSTETRAGALAWIYAGFNISSILGVPVGTYVCNAFGWRATFLFIAGMIVLSLLLIVRYIPKVISVAPAEKKGGSSSQMLRDPRVVMGFLITATAFAGSYMIFTYIRPILQDVIGLGPSTVGIGLMMFGLMCLISNLVAGKLSDMGGLRLGRYIYLMQAVVFVLFPLALTDSVTGFLGLMLIGFMMYLMNSSVQLLFVDIAGKDYPGSLSLASALNPTGFSLGIMSGSCVAGLIYDAAGPASIAYGGAVFFLAAVLLSVALVRYCSKPGRGTSVT